MARLALALPLLVGAPALASTEHWLTTLSLEELTRLEVSPVPMLALRGRTETVAAIRAGCADGHDVCDALRAVLATSKPNQGAAATLPRRALPAAAEPPRPRPDPSMIAGPGHAGYGGAETVEAAVRALGFGLR